MLTGLGVIVDSGLTNRINVYNNVGQPRLGVEEAMADVLGNRVGSPQGHLFVDENVHVGPEAMTEPAHSRRFDATDARGFFGHPYQDVAKRGIDRVHQTAAHRARRVPADKQDGDADQQADNRIRNRSTQPHRDRADQDAERRKSIDLSVPTVGLERGRPDPPASTNPQDRDALVSEKANHGGDHDPPDVSQRRRIDQLLVGLPQCEKRAGDNNQDNRDARQILGAAVTVGVAPIGRPTPNQKRQPERNGSQRIRKIVDCVGEQTDRPALDRDDKLDSGGDAEAEKRKTEGPNAFGTTFESAVGARFMAVEMEDLAEKRQRSGPVDVPVAMAVVGLVNVVSAIVIGLVVVSVWCVRFRGTTGLSGAARRMLVYPQLPRRESGRPVSVLYCLPENGENTHYSPDIRE